MKEPYCPKVDLNSVCNRSYGNSLYFQKYVDCVNDAHADERKEACQCRVCFYVSGRIGGAMMTTSLCGLCGKELHFGSTCTDVLCYECALEHRLCRHCGGDVEMKQRRKL